MIAGLALCAVLEGSRLEHRRLELVGPVEAVTLDAGGFGRTRIDVGLAAGESRALDVLVPRAGGVEPTVEADLAAGGAVRLASSDVDAAIARRWSELPASLRGRPRAPVERTARAGALASLLIAFAALIATLQRRRSTRVALAIGVLASAGVIALGAMRPRGPSALVAIAEGDAASGRWLLVTGARDRIELAEAPLALATEPQSAPLSIRHAWSAGAASIVVEATGATLYAFEDFDPGLRGLTRALNRWADLDRVWLREADGSWTERGPWKLGTPLPAATGAASAPPGALNPALPQGTTVLLARQSDERANALWIRLLGI